MGLPMGTAPVPASTLAQVDQIVGNFLGMMYRMSERQYAPDPVLERALEVLFILHIDHEQNCSTTTMRAVGSSLADPYVAVASAAAALYLLGVRYAILLGVWVSITAIIPYLGAC
jgi:citrate synthase